MTQFKAAFSVISLYKGPTFLFLWPILVTTLTFFPLQAFASDGESKAPIEVVKKDPEVLAREYLAEWGKPKDIKFGFEFTFTSQKLLQDSKPYGEGTVENPFNLAKVSEFIGLIRRDCSLCKVVEVNPMESFDLNFRAMFEAIMIYNGIDPRETYIQLPNGQAIQAKPDVGVVEVTGSPQTRVQFGNEAEMYESVVFKTAKGIGLKAHIEAGGGHIHMDVVSAFDWNPRRFRNYTVDHWMHGEILLAAMGSRNHNMSSLFEAGPEVLKDFMAELERFDARILAFEAEITKAIEANGGDLDLELKEVFRDKGFVLIREHAEIMHEKILNRHPHLGTDVGHSRYWLLNYASIVNAEGPSDDRATVEHRYPRPQTSMGDFLFDAGYMEGRVGYLEAEYRDRFVEFNSTGFRNVTGKAAAKIFREFIRALVDPRAYDRYQSGMERLQSQFPLPFESHATRSCRTRVSQTAAPGIIVPGR